jgi:hypothetical protein
MTMRADQLCHLLCLGLLRGASFLVPGHQREEWWREWSSELWHVRQSCTPVRGISWTAEQEVTAFCLGAFPDALCLREHFRQRRVLNPLRNGSAVRCLIMLTAIAIMSYGIAWLLPGVFVILHSPPYRDAQNLMLIHDAQSSDDSVPTISAEQYHAWKRRHQEIFDGFAFYQISRQPVLTGRRKALLNIAPASLNLFDLLGLPAGSFAPIGEADAAFPKLILSNATWKKEFSGDPNISGRKIQVGSTPAVVAGVMPEGSWRLPGKVDAWLLTTDADIVSGGAGFVIGHLTPTSIHAGWGESWHMTAPKPDGDPEDFFCVSLTERTRGPNEVFWFAVLLACLALPATTSLPLGEYQQSSRALSWPTRLVRWAFLSAKITLLLPIVYLVSLNVAHLRVDLDPISSEYIQLATSFLICLFGLRWTLRDQRRRCPVCLRELTHPARVGQPSRNFLSWNGTELICESGHGLLHVPEISTSWFSEQRWLYLDPSWAILFAEPGFASSVYF